MARSTHYFFLLLVLFCGTSFASNWRCFGSGFTITLEQGGNSGKIPEHFEASYDGEIFLTAENKEITKVTYPKAILFSSDDGSIAVKQYVFFGSVSPEPKSGTYQGRLIVDYLSSGTYYVYDNMCKAEK